MARYSSSDIGYSFGLIQTLSLHPRVAFLPYKAKYNQNQGFHPIPKRLRGWGDHLRKKRLDLGLFQREVGQTLGVTACTIMYWETGRAIPAIKHIPRIVEFLGYSPFNEPKTLAERLVQRRKLLGLSRKQAAKLLGIDPSNLAGWETGKHRPAKKSERVIQRFFNSDHS